MTRSVLAGLALAAILALPFLARSRMPALERNQAAENLVIITPQNEAIRYEFGRAFRAHMARQGRRVEIDWRTPGGSGEITRYLTSAYAASFERYWKRQPGQSWSAKIAAGFARPAPATATDEGAVAHRAFLASDVGSGIDLLFGGGGKEFAKHAAAGRLIDSGIITRHPDLFGAGAIPAEVGGESYWDRGGRWVGACLSSFGICFNRDALARLGVARAPSSWRALGEPLYFAELALADPTKSGAVGTAFEMIVQSRMNAVRKRMQAQTGISEAQVDAAALDQIVVRDGWAEALRLIRRIGANARYFTDGATKIPIDVATGDAAVGMCIDFYGRFQSETTEASGRAGRMGFQTAGGEASIGADPIGMLRGAPHRELAFAFLEFVLSEAGQKLWDFRRGTPGGPERYTLRRLPILPALYDHAFDVYRADPGENPYEDVRGFVYRARWTAPLSNTISFLVRVMCIDPESELQAAYRALFTAAFPPHATALFDDVSLVDYATASGPLRTALQSSDPLEAEIWAIRLVRAFRDQYRQVAVLARAGK